MSFRNITIILSVFVTGIFCGWLIGSRQEVQIVENVRYVERPSSRIDFDMPMPTKVERIELPKLQYHDTVKITERIPADTAGIVADYLKRREYELDFSTDSTGIYKVQAVVYCNRLESASATIAPLQREVERVTELQPRKFRPFVGGGAVIGPHIGASFKAGALLKDHHLPTLGFIHMGKESYMTLGYGYLF